MIKILYIKSGFTILALSLLIAFSSNGQGKDEFEKIFLKETQGSESGQKYGKFKNISHLSYYPDTLPAWFFAPPQSGANNIYAIGISDPDLNPEDAINQAIHRGKTLSVLFNKAKIQYFRDVYTSEYTVGRYTYFGHRFDTYFKLSGSGHADSTCFSIVAQHFTRYNEAIILISYTPNQFLDQTNSLEAISTTGTALYIEAQIGEAFEPQAEYEFISALKVQNASPQTAHFTYRERGNKFLSISEFMGENHDFPLFTYKYSNPSWQHNTPPLVSYNGLWSVFSKKLLRQLTLETEQSSVRIRTLEEQYSPELRNLSREVAIKTAKMHINGIDFGVDSIGFNILLQELNN